MISLNETDHISRREQTFTPSKRKVKSGSTAKYKKPKGSTKPSEKKGKDRGATKDLRALCLQVPIYTNEQKNAAKRLRQGRMTFEAFKTFMKNHREDPANT